MTDPELLGHVLYEALDGTQVRSKIKETIKGTLQKSGAICPHISADTLENELAELMLQSVKIGASTAIKSKAWFDNDKKIGGHI